MLLCIQAKRGAYAGRGAHRAENRCRMKAGFMYCLRYDCAQAAHHFSADCDAKKSGSAIRPVAFARRQHRRHNHRAGMHGATFKCIVKVFAMRRRAIEEGSAGSTEAARMTDGGARPIVVAACQRAA